MLMCWVCTLVHREINRIGLCINEFILNAQHSMKFNKPICFQNVCNKEPEQLGVFNNERDDNVPGKSSAIDSRTGLRSKRNQRLLVAIPAV